MVRISSKTGVSKGRLIRVLAVLALVMTVGCAAERTRTGPDGASRPPGWVYTFSPDARDAKVYFSPDCSRFLVLEQVGASRTRVVVDGRPRGEYAWAAPLWSAKGPFSADSRSLVYAAGEIKGGKRLVFNGFPGAVYEELGPWFFTSSGVIYGAKKQNDWFIVRSWIAGGRLWEEPEGPYLTRPVFAQNGDFFCQVKTGPSLVLEGPNFSRTLPLDQMQEQSGVAISKPDVFALAKSPTHFLAFLGSTNGPPEAVNALLAMVSDDGESQLRLSPMTGYHGIRDNALFHSTGRRLAFFAREEKGGLRSVVVDLKDRAFGQGPDVGVPTSPAFNPRTLALAYVVKEGGSSRYYSQDFLGPRFLDIREMKFSADGKQVAYLARDKQGWLAVVNHEAVAGPFEEIYRLDFSLDGKGLVVSLKKGRMVLNRTLGLP